MEFRWWSQPPQNQAKCLNTWDSLDSRQKRCVLTGLASSGFQILLQWKISPFGIHIISILQLVSILTCCFGKEKALQLGVTFWVDWRDFTPSGVWHFLQLLSISVTGRRFISHKEPSQSRGRCCRPWVHCAWSWDIPQWLWCFMSGSSAFLRTSEMLSLQLYHLLLHDRLPLVTVVIPFAKTSNGNPQVVQVKDPFLHQLSRLVKRQQDRRSFLYPGSQASFRKFWRILLQRLQFHAEDYSPYGIRRGGPPTSFYRLEVLTQLFRGEGGWCPKWLNNI